MIKKIKINKICRSIIIYLALSLFLSLNTATVFSDDGVKVNIKSDGVSVPPSITAEAAVLVNLNSDKVIYEKYADKTVFPASSVKLMTAILVIENVENLEQQTIISQNVINKTAGNQLSPSMIAGEVFTIKDLLYALLIHGANDAALALAEFVAGSEAEFVMKMNDKANELGCKHTVFTNPHGIHSDTMYTTALDVAKIATHASTIQQIMDISTTPKHNMPITNKTDRERPLLNRNHFVSKAYTSQYFYSYAQGMNSGSTTQAGYCLVTTATQKGVTYLCVILGASSTPIANTRGELINSFSDAKSLFEWVFSIYSYRTVIREKQIICEVKIKLSADKDYVGLVPDKDIEALLVQNTDIETEISIVYTIYEDKLVAPITKGQHLGDLVVSYGDDTIGTAKLLANADVELSNVLYGLQRIEDIVSTRWFRASVIIFLILFSFYITVALIRTSRSNKRKFI